ncbi:GGDEF domain-containing protein [Paraburkholderia sp. UCT70]|uniref:GGDEF domain-containing protein n=1 Tax=Paraburkholderia sp. UCT70 TaxID=2991068 RepID=UPI003D25A169
MKPIEDLPSLVAAHVVLLRSLACGPKARDFAQTALGAVRRSDIVSRIGGDEFLIVLPGASLDEASAAIERVRREVSGRTVWTSPGRRIRYASSAGCARSCLPTMRAVHCRERTAHYTQRNGRAGTRCNGDNHRNGTGT